MMAKTKKGIFKRTAAVVCAIGLLFGLAAPVSADDEVWTDIIQADFSDGIPTEVGQVAKSGTITWNEEDQNVRVELPASGGVAPYLEFSAGGAAAERYMFEADFYVGDNFGVSSNLVGKGSTKGEGFNIESGKIGIPGTNLGYAVTGNSWYHIKYIFDISAGTCELYVNETLVGKDIPIRNAQPEFYTLRIFNWRSGGYYIIDNIKLKYQQKPSNLTAVLTAPKSDDRYEVGDTIAVTAEASSDIGVSKVEFYCNGSLVGVGEEEPYTFSYLAKTAGSASFYAVAYDSRGGLMQTDSITVNIRESSRPVIRFLNLRDGGTYLQNELDNVTVSAKAPGGVEKVELFVNGKLWETATEEPYVFDLSGAAAGNAALSAKAYTADGYDGSAEAVIEILPKQDRISIIDTDFEKGLPTAMDSYPDRDGKIDFVTVDAEHGQSVRVEKPGDSSPYLILRNAESADRYVMEADFYMGADFGLSTNLVGREKPDGTGFSIESGNLILYDGNDAKTLAPINSETWYRVKLETDFRNNTYSLWLDGKKVAEDFAMRYVINGFNSIRIFNWKKGSYYCIDNLKFYGVVEYPVISHISCGDSLTDTEIPYNAEKLNVVLSAGINSGQVTADTVRLLADGAEVPLSGVALKNSNVVEIRPKYNLVSNKQYEVWLSGELQNLMGNKIGTPLTAQFITKSKPLDLTMAEFDETDGKLNFKTVVNNSTDEAQTCIAVVNIWEGQQTVSTHISIVEAEKGKETELTVSDMTITAAQRAEAFVINSFENPMPISDKVFSCSR